MLENATNNLSQAPEEYSDKLLQKPSKNYPKYYPKTLTAMKLVEAGETPLSALQIVNNKSDITLGAAHLLKKKIEKYNLARPRIQKLVDSQAVRILKGEGREVLQRKLTKTGEVVEYMETIPVTDTAITAVMGMSLDRSQPVKTINTNLNLSVECSPVDLDRWQNRGQQAALPVDNSQSGTVIDAHNIVDVSK